jgi:hypothetical protein
VEEKKNHTREERLTDAASSTQQSTLVFHYSEPAELVWKTGRSLLGPCPVPSIPFRSSPFPYWDLVPFLPFHSIP